MTPATKCCQQYKKVQGQNRQQACRPNAKAIALLKRAIRISIPITIQGLHPRLPPAPEGAHPTACQILISNQKIEVRAPHWPPPRNSNRLSYTLCMGIVGPSCGQPFAVSEGCEV